ncbi:MAG TPA: RNA methyltransferase [Ktedonobacterales bacterium]|jgi:TrmH family RNA methyltransferase
MITSPSNPKVALLRSLHTPKGRAEAGAFLVEGPHVVGAALEAGVVPFLLLYEPAALGRADEGRILLDALTQMGDTGQTETLEANARALAHASDTQTPQGVVGAVALADVAPERLRARRRGRFRPLLLVLDELADPGNLGTILRSALAADVDEVLLTRRCVDPYNPKVVRAASGAHFHLPIASQQRWEQIAQRLAGAPKTAQVLLAEANAQRPYYDVDLTRRTALIIGNEARGPSAEARRLATGSVSIPMWNGVESLNAAIAASLLLFEAARQQRSQ